MKHKGVTGQLSMTSTKTLSTNSFKQGIWQLFRTILFLLKLYKGQESFQLFLLSLTGLIVPALKVSNL